MGRPAKSTYLHKLHGTQSQAAADKPSGFVGGRPKFPKHLSPAAKKAFEHAVALLEARHTLTEGDEVMLALYATVYERWLEAKSCLVGNLMVDIPVLDSNGQVHVVKRVNPLLKVATECEARLLTIDKTLGLSPVDRERSKQTALDPKEEVVPGSIEDLNPEWLNPRADVIPFTPLPPSTEEENEGNG